MEIKSIFILKNAFALVEFLELKTFHRFIQNEKFSRGGFDFYQANKTGEGNIFWQFAGGILMFC